MMHLGILIKEYRDEYGLSMDDFADKSGLSKAYISMLEKNENSRSKKPIIPSLETIKAVSDAIGLDFNKVIEMIDPDTEVKLTSTTVKINKYIRNTIEKMDQLNEDSKEDVSKYADFIYSDKNNRIQSSTGLDFSEYISTYSIGTAAAGEGFEYGDYVTEYKLFMTTDIPDHDFSLNVKGDSMFPTIIDGETIFIIKNYDKIDNDIYVLDIDGETTVKRVKFGKDEIILISDNEEYDDRIVTGYELANTRILGRVVGWEMPT